MFELNRENGKYEFTFKVQVDRGCFTKALFAYIEQNGIDPTNPVEMERAVRAVSRFDHWKDHPHAVIVFGEQKMISSTIEKKEEPTPAPKPAPKRWKLTDEEIEDLRARAKGLQPSLWEDKLLTKTPDTVYGKDRQWYSNRRTLERKVLDELREELKDSPLERMSAVKELMGANGIH